MNASGPAASLLPVLPPGEEIYDLRSPAVVPYPWLETILWWAAIFATGFLAFRLLRWYFTPVPEKQLAPPPPPDPLEEALQALERLKLSPIWMESRLKDICEALSIILKNFLKERFSLGLGKAATSDELLSDLRDQNVNSEIFGAVSNLLEVCDGIKFAKGTLGNHTMESLFRMTRELIIRKDWR